MGIPGGYRDPFSETVLGISLPESTSLLARSEPKIEMFSATLYDYEIGPTDILPIPTPQYALSATPSTRYSESPGPFSVSSTPTSMSSYSPATALSKTSLRTRQASPLQSRPPVTRHRTPDDSNTRHPHALSTVRESSSSSASTVIADGLKQKEKQSPTRLATLPQSPPMTNSAQVPEKARTQAPPELAHLADRSSIPGSNIRRPSRPSRDGTPEIAGIRDPSPIIQSNMSSFPTSHRRTSSNDTKISQSSNLRPNVIVPVKSSSRIPSPNPASVPSSTSRGLSRGPTPDLQSDRDARRNSTLPTTGTAPSPSKTSRFGFFSRRTKTEPAPAMKSDNKLHRRGPAAGTGHEGYGKYAARGRSGSSVSATSIGRSPSAGTTTESLDQTPSTRKSSMTSTTSTDMDDFFLNRLAPVVIRGTGSSSEFSRSPEPMQSTSSLDVSLRTESDPKNPVKPTSKFGIETKKPTLLPSAMPDTARGGSPMKKMAFGRRRPSESDDDTKKSFLPSAVSRRTSGGLSNSEGSSGARPAQNARVPVKGRKNSISDLITEGKEGSWLKSSKKAKAEKEQPKTSRKWNFFQRAHAAPQRTATPVVVPSSSVNQVPVSRSVAHYALMDDSELDMNDIEKLMQEASTPDDGTESALSEDETGRKERMQSMLLPPKPILPPNLLPPIRCASPKVPLRQESQSRDVSSKLSIHTDLEPKNRQSESYSMNEFTPIDLSPPSSPFHSDLTFGTELVTSPLNISTAEESTMFVSTAAASAQHDFTLPEHIPSPGPPPVSPPPRPSRLPQVGRIPQVISSRRQPRRPSSQSFSRPFAVNQPRPVAHAHTSFDSIGGIVATSAAVEPYPILQGLGALSHGSAIATISPPLDDNQRQSEFFKFPPRKDSEVSYSSSSGVWSFAPAAGTAIVPGPGAPLSEDELWNEYDDLIDQVLSPSTSRTHEESGNVRSQHPSLEPLPLKTKFSRVTAQSDHSDTEATVPSLHLRRSRLLAVLHSNQSPTSPVSFSEFIQDYGERKISVLDPVTGRLSLPASPRLSTGSTAKRSTRSSLPALLSLSTRQSRATFTSKSSKDRESIGTNRYRDTRLMDIAESQADGLLSMANLRFCALMTSKWLSFGRVLFSPIHYELKDPREDRVLVIDGLGKDWSYYCALTYPEATVYDIGPEPSSATTTKSNVSEAWSTLPNYRHICHASLSQTFPFPMHFFACVVLRFPTALPSAEHRFILSEAKRVLRPGGYLEFSVLDMDLVNMGNRARRAVRGLKMRMQVANENVSLRNMSDEIMAGIGRKGFVECNRCILGVPVAGTLPDLNEAKSSKSNRKGSVTSSGDKSNELPQQSKGLKPEVSFSDLLNRASTSDTADTGITDMVARVGRWWYSRCYESLVLPEAGEPGASLSGDLLQSSIWRDETLVNECEKRGTTFKLLIGYAQKPEVGVRRTVSV